MYDLHDVARSCAMTVRDQSPGPGRSHGQYAHLQPLLLAKMWQNSSESCFSCHIINYSLFSHGGLGFPGWQMQVIRFIRRSTVADMICLEMGGNFIYGKIIMFIRYISYRMTKLSILNSMKMWYQTVWLETDEINPVGDRWRDHKNSSVQCNNMIQDA